MRIFPKQRLPYKEKISENFKWAKDVIHYLLSYYTYSNREYSSVYNTKLSNYQLYNNILNQSDFERECNPLGLDVGQFKDAIQPYNKTYNKIQVLLGEELRRPFNFKSVLTNSEGVKSKLAYKDSLYRNYLYSQIQNHIKQISNLYSPDLLEVAQESIMEPEQIEEYYSTSYLESREILASKLLQYLVKTQNIKDKKNDAFKHALIAGEEILYVGIENDTPIVDVLNPLGVFYHKSGETKWIQDSLFAGYRTYLTTGEVLDKYGAYLSEEDIEKIQSKSSVGVYAHTPTPDMQYHHNDWYQVNNFQTYTEGSYSNSSTQDWLVQTVEWRSEKKVGFLKFTNEFGDIEEDIVSEDFEVPTGAKRITVKKEFNKKCVYYVWEVNGVPYSLEWGWIPEIWTGTKIGHDIYTLIGPKQEQFRSLDNPYDVKLGFHGVVYNSMNAPSVSLMDRMKPFQYLYFIIMHKLKKLIAQDKGRIFHFDVSMVDENMGLEKTLYYLSELNIDFFNPLQNADKPGWSQRGKVASSTDMSQAQHIMNYINLLASIDQQISDVAGVNRQREGQTTPGEAVTNAQANIQMSSVITEIYFETHNKVWEQVLSSLVQTAQYVYKHKGVTKQFVLDDLNIATLEILPEQISNCDFGVFITNSSKEEDLFQNIKALSQALVQNDKANFSDLIHLFKANSVEELEEKIEASERRAEQQLQQQQQQQQEAAIQLQKDQQQFELEKLNMELQTKVLIAEIDSFKFQRDQDINDNAIPDQFELQKWQEELKLKKEKLRLEEKKINKMAINKSK